MATTVAIRTVTKIIFSKTLMTQSPIDDGSSSNIAFKKGFIDKAQLKEIAQPLLKSGYGDYLMGLVKED